MTAAEHSPVNRADEGEARDQSGGVPRTHARLDREKANGILNAAWRNEITHATALDALEVRVVPAPPQGVDRVAWPEHTGQEVAIVDRLSGRELPGIALTPEEAQLALGAIEDQIVGIYHRPMLRALGALAHRLDPDFPAPEDEEASA